MTSNSAREPEGVHNFRELGPYRVAGGGHIRSRMIYRSGALELMTEADAAWLGEDVHVKTILDLRHPEERTPGSAHALHERVLPLSIFPEGQTQESLIAELNGLYGMGPSPMRYLHYLEVGGERLAEAFRLFARGSAYPMLIHCTAGKDRTGVLVGMIMDVLGASHDDIAAEYGLSDASIDRLVDYLRSTGRALQGSEAEIRARLSTPPERMAGFIGLLQQKHGGAEAFFLAKGVTPTEIDAVRACLVDA